VTAALAIYTELLALGRILGMSAKTTISQAIYATAVEQRKQAPGAL
jgi:hypothetical protein